MQGDVISPFIFVVCMERLGHIIQNAVAKGKWKTIQLSRYGLELSDLFFADDLILFAEASVEQINIVKDCLDKSSAISGRVNFQKLSICFSNGVPRGTVEGITRIVGIPLTDNLGRYLGTPSIHMEESIHVCTSIERMTSKLESWKAKYLTMAGRVTLTKAILTSIPTYLMQTTLLPRGIYSAKDGLIRIMERGRR